MFHYLTRKKMNERLHIEQRTSFRIIPRDEVANKAGFINSDKLLTLINRVRVNCPVLTSIPVDFATLDELAEALRETGITRRNLFRWTRRKRNPLPHFRFNSHTIRYSCALCEAWIDQQSIQNV